MDPLLDVRALDTGHAGRGIGSFVRSLAAMGIHSGFVTSPGQVGPFLESPNVATDRVCPPPSSEVRIGWAGSMARTAWCLRSVDRPVHFPFLDAAYGTHSPAVVSVLDLIPLRFPHLYPAGRFRHLRCFADRLLARRADRLTALSTATADDAVRFLGVRGAQLEVIGATWDEGVDRPDHAAVALLDLPERFVLVSGGFTHPDPRKRLEDAVRALPLLPDDVSVVMTGGRGPAERNIWALAAELSVSPRLVLTGHLPPPALAAVYARASALAFPSAWEGFGVPLVNAFRCGLPAVVARGGSLPEVAGDAALVHEVGDIAGIAALLNEVLSDNRTAGELRAAGRRRATDFAPQVLRDKYRAVFDAL